MDKKEEYKLLLQTKEWKKKSKEVMTRDNFKCTKCGETHNLNVHHTYYYPGKTPWEYTSNSLKTLCESCHEQEHRINPPKTRKRREKTSTRRVTTLQAYEHRVRREYIEKILKRKLEDWEF